MILNINIIGSFYKVVRMTVIDEDHPPNCVMCKITSADIQVIQRFWIYPLWND